MTEGAPIGGPTGAEAAAGIESTGDRGAGALHGLAIGDALGMPTQLLPRRVIAERYGPVLTGFEPGPDDHPIAAGMAAGSVTDDTEQAVLLGRMLVAGGGHLDPHRWAESLLAWEHEMEARGSLDLLGPSTRSALAALAGGSPVESCGRYGDTNGAAMRIAPVGIATAVASTGDIGLLVDRVVAASLVTHNTGIALAGAAAVAACVSAGISGASLAEAIELGIVAATVGARRGHWVAGAQVAGRIRWAIRLVGGVTRHEAIDQIYGLVGTSLATQESVPAAFAVLAAGGDDPWQACLTAASLGGDCDTIAAMVGAMAGAAHGKAAFPAAAVDLIEDRNHLQLDALSSQLLALRAAPVPPSTPGAR
jgi:ADP-ribosylglycohydrolase